MTRACRAAVDELLAARKLIEAQGAELVASKAALDAKAVQLKLMADQNQLLIEQADSLKEALAAREAQIKSLEDLIGKFRLRIADLEKKSARGRKVATGAFVGGLLLGVAAGR